jgi:hypothetical protein
LRTRGNGNACGEIAELEAAGSKFAADRALALAAQAVRDELDDDGTDLALGAGINDGSVCSIGAASGVIAPWYRSFSRSETANLLIYISPT